jgi:hypothetical protein
MDNLITWNFQNEFSLKLQIIDSLQIQVNMVLNAVKFNKDLF